MRGVYVLPNSLFIKAEGFLLPKDSAANASAENGEVRRRIHAARTAVDDIERSVSAVSKRLSEMESCAGEKLMLEVQSSVCCGCGRYDFCWEQNFKETRNALDEMYETLKKAELCRAISSRRRFRADVYGRHLLPKHIQGCFSASSFRKRQIKNRRGAACHGRPVRRHKRYAARSRKRV